MRPIKFDPDLEAVYSDLFEPMMVSRAQFRKLVGPASGNSGGGATTSSSNGSAPEAPANNNAIAQIITLHTGQYYAFTLHTSCSNPVIRV